MQQMSADIVQGNAIPFDGTNWNDVTDRFHEVLKTQSWYTPGEEPWWNQIASRTLQRMIQQQTSKTKSQLPPKNMDQWLNDGVNSIFFDPDVVEMIYSVHEDKHRELVNYGANLHCRWSESVVKNLVYRHTQVVNQLSVQTDNLIDELWGMVMEEAVMCLTDVVVHLWKEDGSHIELPPPGTKGRRRGNFLRVAISDDGKWLAGYRIDHQVFIWNMETQERISQIDCNCINGEEESSNPVMILFAADKKKIAVEYPNQNIALIHLNNNDEIQWFDQQDQQQFEQVFGKINMPQRNGLSPDMEHKITDVHDWVTDGSGKVLVTASRQTRQVPDWMRKAGFERSIRHIAKKRLIDLIRKYSHTAYACWQCGSMQSTLVDTKCKNCDADFTTCPIGCGETIKAENHWQCSSCGYATRHYQAYQEVEPESLERVSDTNAAKFQDEIDYQKLIVMMSQVFVTYKNRNIPCAVLMQYKSDGCTNEAIGKELNVPRGTVDYLWNQCKSHIQKQMGLSV